MGLALPGIFIGIALLYFCSDWVVGGAKALALRLGVSPFAVGLTVVALGSCIPEAATSLVSGANPDIIVGNIVGSNIANIGLVIGLSATVSTIPCCFQSVKFDMFFTIAALGVVFLLSLGGFLGWPEATVMFAIIAAFLAFSFRYRRPASDAEAEGEEEGEGAGMGYAKCMAMIVLGIAGVYVGARVFIDGAVDLARIAGVSDQFIGLVVVALGSVLPEMFVTLMAAYRNESELAISNVLGSIIFNSLFALPLGALFVGAPATDTMLMFHMPVMMVMGVMLVLVIHGDDIATKKEGVALVAMYLFYVALLFLFPELTEGVISRVQPRSA